MTIDLKKIKIIMLWIMIAMLFTGCSYQNELNDLKITIGMGIDKDALNPRNVKLIAQIVKPEELSEPLSGDGDGPKGYMNIESSGENTFDAIREFTHSVHGRLYMAHNVVFVIGKDAAEEGINQYLDFFIRSLETRPLTKIIIVEGTASEALEVKTEFNTMPAMCIDYLIEAQYLTAHSTETTIKDYINAMVSKTSSFTAPILRIKRDEDKETMYVEGIAVFKQDKLIGALDKEESRGLLWVKGQVESGPINIDIDEGKVAIEIADASSKVTYKFAEGKPVVNVEISVEGLLATQTCKRNLETLDGIKQLEHLMKNEIEEEIKKSLKKAQNLNCDIYDFGEGYHKYHNENWEKMAPYWDEIFPVLSVDFEVKGKIVSAGTIVKPISP